MAPIAASPHTATAAGHAHPKNAPPKNMNREQKQTPATVLPAAFSAAGFESTSPGGFAEGLSDTFGLSLSGGICFWIDPPTN